MKIIIFEVEVVFKAEKWTDCFIWFLKWSYVFSAYDPISMFKCKGTFVGHQVGSKYADFNYIQIKCEIT